MKLAEALSLRANATRRIESLRTRIVSNARYQEGEDPAEDASALLVDADNALREYEDLIRRINRTNAATVIDAAGTLTDALARRVRCVCATTCSSAPPMRLPAPASPATPDNCVRS